MATQADRVAEVRAGNRRAMAALIRDLEDEKVGARQVLEALQSVEPADGSGGMSPAEHPDRLVVGITGGPGSGKSTLVDAMIAHWRALGERVGVVAVDPSSPRSGGSILGDRVRMQRHATDPGVFIRSVASRGALGGLSGAAMDAVAVLVAGGFSRVLLETVGTGQSEVDVAGAADVTVVVVTPGQGDEVQMLKAGLLEIADVLVLNKADRPDADSALRDLQAMLSLREPSAPVPASGAEARDPARARARAEIPIVRTVATRGEGVAELVKDLEAAAVALGGAVSEAERRRHRARARITRFITTRVETAVREALAPSGSGASLAEAVAACRLDVESAAKTLMDRLAEGYYRS